MKLYIEWMIATDKAKLLIPKIRQVEQGFQEQLKKVGFGDKVEVDITLLTTDSEAGQGQVIKFNHPFSRDYALIGMALTEGWKIVTKDIAGLPNIYILPRIVGVTAQIIS